MFALIAAIIVGLRALGVLDDTSDIQWYGVGLAVFFLHFAFEVGLPPWPRRS